MKNIIDNKHYTALSYLFDYYLKNKESFTDFNVFFESHIKDGFLSNGSQITKKDAVDIFNLFKVNTKKVNYLIASNKDKELVNLYRELYLKNQIPSADILTKNISYSIFKNSDKSLKALIKIVKGLNSKDKAYNLSNEMYFFCNIIASGNYKLIPQVITCFQFTNEKLLIDHGVKQAERDLNQHILSQWLRAVYRHQISNPQDKINSSLIYNYVPNISTLIDKNLLKSHISNCNTDFISIIGDKLSKSQKCYVVHYAIKYLEQKINADKVIETLINSKLFTSISGKDVMEYDKNVKKFLEKDKDKEMTYIELKDMPEALERFKYYSLKNAELKTKKEETKTASYSDEDYDSMCL